MKGDPWTELERELDAWKMDGRTATVWLRDDDATAPSAALDRLFNITGERPLALAVIPAELDPSLALLIEPRTAIDILPHGFGHRNHEPAGVKKSEYGASRTAGEASREMSEADRILRQAFAQHYVALFVPPWNRITPAISHAAIQGGMTGISVFGDRQIDTPFPGLNTHVDLLDWGWKKSTGSARFAGERVCLSDLVGALNRRRLARCGTDSMEAVGILSHHLDHDEATWGFLDQLLTVLDRHPGIEWTAARDAIRPGSRSTKTGSS